MTAYSGGEQAFAVWVHAHACGDGGSNHVHAARGCRPRPHRPSPVPAVQILSQQVSSTEEREQQPGARGRFKSFAKTRPRRPWHMSRCLIEEPIECKYYFRNQLSKLCTFLAS